MRRALVGLAVAALVSLGLTAPATAAPGQVTHIRIAGALASASWNVKSEAGMTDTNIQVGHLRKGGYQLSFNRWDVTWDQNGTILDGNSTYIEATTGFTFSMDAGKLTAATLHATGLIATTCDVGPDGQDIQDTCTTAPMDLSATWTGEGPLVRSVTTFHVKVGSYSYGLHAVSTDRAATITATFGSWAMSTDDLMGAGLSNVKQGEIELCRGLTC